jgi:hypothetical protein
MQHMTGFDSVAWFPLCAGLTVLGLVASWLAWRRRGAAAGLRGAGWSLLPLAAYLTGLVTLVWDMGTAVVGWLAGFAFSPRVWAGVAVTVLAVACLGFSGLLRRRGPGPAPGSSVPDRSRPATDAASPRPPAPVRRSGTDDELAEAEEILRRRGIR